MKYPRRNLALNEEVQHILNEKKGVSSNTTKTVDYLKFLIEDCMNAAMNSKTIAGIPSLKSQRLIRSFDAQRDLDANCEIFSYRYLFPKTALTDWLSDYSFVDIICKKYNSEKSLLADPEHNGDVFSNCEPNFGKDNKTVVYMKFELSFAVRYNYFFIGGYKIPFDQKEGLIPLIQHEMNHVNKRNKSYLQTPDYKKYYNMNYKFITKEENKNVQNIANLIYRYCIPTEREAYTEQFYKEWINLFKAKYSLAIDYENRKRGVGVTDSEREEIGKYTKTYREYEILRSWLILYRNELLTQDNSKMLYEKFKDIALYFLKLKYVKFKDNYTEWCRQFLDCIEKNMEQFEKRCIKTTHIIDSKRQTVTEKIEEMLSYK